MASLGYRDGNGATASGRKNAVRRLGRMPGNRAETGRHAIGTRFRAARHQKPVSTRQNARKPHLRAFAAWPYADSGWGAVRLSVQVWLQVYEWEGFSVECKVQRHTQITTVYAVMRLRYIHSQSSHDRFR